MEILKAALAAMEQGREAVLVTVVGAQGSTPREAGARMLVYADGSTAGTIGGGAVEHATIREALESLAAGAPRRFSPELGRDLGMQCGGSMDLFIEPLRRPEKLVIFGAGHVASATAPLARSLGFDVTVVDPRAELVTEARFPGCHLLAAEHEATAAALQADDRTWLLLMTHGHGHDLEILRLVVRHRWAWLGLIASRRKVATFKATLGSEGVPAEDLERVSSPVGLPLGAETPAEIAISIAAEWVKLRRAQAPQQA